MHGGALCVLVLGALAAGCAGGRGPGSLGAPAAEVVRLEVPFFPDKTDQCGPSVLASVLSFWGQSVEPAALKREIYIAHLKGSLIMDLMLSARNRGMQARLYKGDLPSLKSELRQGRPLIVFINRGWKAVPIGHYMVVNGYDEARQGLYVHSALSEDKFIPYGRFLKDWNKAERSTLLVLPQATSSKEILRGKS